MKLKTILTALALAALMTAPSFAGDRGGNGGDGVEIDGKLYLLDLVEAGVERNPHFDASLTVTENLRSRIHTKFPSSDYPTDLIVQKIAEIERVDPLFARLLVRGMELYSWRIIAHNLINIADENTLLDGAKLYQLAIRRDSAILIDRQYWDRLDASNRAALVFHEILYAFVKTSNGLQDSVVARDLTGFIFDRELSVRCRDGLKEKMSTRFTYQPNIHLYYSRVMDNGSDSISFNPYLQMELANGDFSTPFFGVYLTDHSKLEDNNTSYFCQLARHEPGHQYVILKEQNQVAHVSLETQGLSTYVNVRFTTRTLPTTHQIPETATCETDLFGVFRQQRQHLEDIYTRIR